MKNKNILIVIIIISLTLVAFYFYKSNQKDTKNEVKGAKFDFAIKDTNSITKIFIVDEKGASVTLNKIENVWKVNNKYDARPESISLLMKTFARIDVKFPVPKAAFKTVVKNIASGSKKVEIYQGNDKPSKVYYIGNATMDEQGTYMLLETDGVKSTVPYVMHIPGFNGFLNSRFFTSAQQWRDAVVFKYQPDQIKSITVNHFEEPSNSFKIIKENNDFILTDVQGNKINANRNNINEFVGRFKKVYYEMIDDVSSKTRKDSILNAKPYFSISVIDIKNDTNKIIAYRMPNYKNKEDVNGKIYKFDLDRMYANLNNQFFIFIQYPTFNKIAINKKDFN